MILKKPKILFFILLVIDLFFIVDLLFDYTRAVSKGHLFFDQLFVLVFTCLLGLVVLMFPRKKSKCSADDHINKQAALWELTPVENEICLLLIKGLSFKEIADLRKTKEQTVRQQALKIYKKSNLSGRHELTAYFVEDLS